ncbi:uncharacterized protein LOC116223157 isoform X2 [Clupea harengus]|nr:uncharacterized protein LOC116223157 isoform X2 [Clupea harengus]
MIRAAFIIAFSDEELDWAIEKVIRCVGFLTLNILMPALRVCGRMEASATQREILLVQAAAGGKEVYKGPRAEGDCIDARIFKTAHRFDDVESPMPASQSRADFNILYSRRLPKGRQNHANEFKFVVAKALEIPTLLLESLTPGYAVWRRGFYAGSQDISEFLKNNKNQLPTRQAFIGLIQITSELLIDLRTLILRKQSTRAEGSVTQEGNYFKFEDFIKFILDQFVLESARNFLERLMNAPSLLRLRYASRIGTEAAEMAFLSQVFVPERGSVMKLLITAISKNVAYFLHDALDIMARKRAQLVSDTDSETEYSHTETHSDTSVSTSSLTEDTLQSQDCAGQCETLSPGQGGGALAERGVTQTLTTSSSSSSSEVSRSHSTSTCSLNSLPPERPHESSSLFIRPGEAVATVGMSPHEDSANVKSSRGEDKQRRKRIFTIRWKSNRSIAPAPVTVVETSAPHSTVRTSRPSLSSRIASGISRLLCCCKGQE